MVYHENIWDFYKKKYTAIIYHKIFEYFSELGNWLHPSVPISNNEVNYISFYTRFGAALSKVFKAFNNLAKINNNVVIKHLNINFHSNEFSI